MKALLAGKNNLSSLSVCSGGYRKEMKVCPPPLPTPPALDLSPSPVKNAFTTVGETEEHE